MTHFTIGADDHVTQKSQNTKHVIRFQQKKQHPVNSKVSFIYNYFIFKNTISMDLIRIKRKN